METKYRQELLWHWRNAYTHNFAFGVEHQGNIEVYLMKLSIDGLHIIFSDKPTVSKRQTVVKYRHSKAKRAYMQANAVESFTLCTIQELNAKRRTLVNRKGETYVENCGECFEWLLAERFGVTQNDKSNLSYTDGGDLTIDGVPYQVKYERAGITVKLE